MIKYKGGYKYQLVEDYEVKIKIFPENDILNKYISLYTNGTLWIKEGYAWDGATMAISSKTFMRGSLVHDALYQLMREGELPQYARKLADIELRNICLEDKMFSIRAWWVYNAVRIGAESAASTEQRKNGLTAP